MMGPRGSVLFPAYAVRTLFLFLPPPSNVFLVRPTLVCLFFWGGRSGPLHACPFPPPSRASHPPFLSFLPALIMSVVLILVPFFF
jgi:hypothetical protein